jgi:hypothetical protein
LIPEFGQAAQSVLIARFGEFRVEQKCTHPINFSAIAGGS